MYNALMSANLTRSTDEEEEHGRTAGYQTMLSVNEDAAPQTHTNSYVVYLYNLTAYFPP